MKLKELFAAAGALLLAAPSWGQVDAAPPISPLHQSEIRGVLDAGTPRERDAALERLAALAGEDDRELVAQLVHYTHAAKATRDAMAFGVVTRALHVADGSIVRGVVPFLESDALRAHAAGILSEFERAEAERRPTFSLYRPFVEERVRAGQPPPPGLTLHLFATDPGMALLLFARVHLRDPEALRALLWAEHVLADLDWRRRHGFPTVEVEPNALTQLTVLARHDAWWARLGAAALVAQRQARLTALDERALDRLAGALERDPHPLVRRALGAD